MTTWLALWWMKLLAIGAIIGAFWLAIHTYNTKITAKAVAKAETTLIAFYKPKFEGLTTRFNDLRTQVITDRLNATSAANAAIAQEKLNASIATRKYQSALKSARELAIQRDAARLAPAELDRLLNNIAKPLAAGDGAGQSGIRLGGYTEGLAGLYSQCERDLGEAIATAATAVDRAGSAEAAVRALSPAP